MQKTQRNEAGEVMGAGAPDRGTPGRGAPGRGTPACRTPGPRGLGAPDRATPDRGAPDRGAPDLGPRSAERGPPGSGPPAPWDHETGSFGTWLRRQREGRGIDLREIAEESKISMVNLRAFEDDRFDILPAPVFAKGFLRQYASYVGLDPEEVVNFYVSACRSGEGEEEPVAPPTESRSGNSWRLGVLALALTVICALLIWLLARWNDRPPVGASSPPTASAPRTAAELPADTAASPPGSAAAPDRSTLAEPGTGSASSSPQGAVSEPESPGPAVRRSDRPPGSTPLRVILDFSGACWVEAAVDGERQIAENKVQGESLLLEATERIELTIGNIDAVGVEVNGLPFEFDDVPGTKVRTQRIDLETVAALSGSRGERG